jgi:hypothetical protein
VAPRLQSGVGEATGDREGTARLATSKKLRSGTTMSMTLHMGWQIESRSYKGDFDSWCPRALVSIFEGGRFCTHDVRALLTVTFDTARDADDYAVRMAKKWIEERYYRPLSLSVSARRGAAVVAGDSRR